MQTDQASKEERSEDREDNASRPQKTQ